MTPAMSLAEADLDRAPLRVRGEREYAGGPLAQAMDPETLAPADLARAPAVRLFVERVRDVQPDFRLTAENGTTIAGAKLTAAVELRNGDRFACGQVLLVYRESHAGFPTATHVSVADETTGRH